VSIGTSFPLGRAPGVGPRGGLAFPLTDPSLLCIIACVNY
jgi:hypothetical protein